MLLTCLEMNITRLNEEEIPLKKSQKAHAVFPFMICWLKNILFDSMKYVMSVVGCDYVLYIKNVEYVGVEHISLAYYLFSSYFQCMILISLSLSICCNVSNIIHD